MVGTIAIEDRGSPVVHSVVTYVKAIIHERSINQRKKKENGSISWEIGETSNHATYRKLRYRDTYLCIRLTRHTLFKDEMVYWRGVSKKFRPIAKNKIGEATDTTRTQYHTYEYTQIKSGNNHS